MDFILDGRVAVEVKSAKRVQPKHLKGLQALREDGIVDTFIVVCREDRPRRQDGINIWAF